MKRAYMVIMVISLMMAFTVSPAIAGLEWKTLTIPVESGETVSVPVTVTYDAYNHPDAISWGFNVEIIKNADGKVITSGVVTVNGNEILGQSDFSQKFRGYASALTKDDVNPGVNDVFVKANGKPGTKMVVKIEYPEIVQDEVLGDIDCPGTFRDRFNVPKTVYDASGYYRAYCTFIPY